MHQQCAHPHVDRQPAVRRAARHDCRSLTASPVRPRSAALGCCVLGRSFLPPAGGPAAGSRSVSPAGSSVCSTLTLTCRFGVGDSCSCTCPWTLTAPCGTCSSGTWVSSSGGSPGAYSVTAVRSISNGRIRLTGSTSSLPSTKSRSPGHSPRRLQFPGAGAGSSPRRSGTAAPRSAAPRGPTDCPTRSRSSLRRAGDRPGRR